MSHLTLPYPSLAAGVTLLGEYQGSGFTEPHYLIVRADQQMLHVSRLLFVVASHLDGTNTRDEIAAQVSQEYGRTLTAEGLDYLVRAKLRPMGLVVRQPSPTNTPSTPTISLGAPAGPGDGAPVGPSRSARPLLASLPRANPLLAVRFRGTLIPAPVTRALARRLSAMFFAPIVVVGVLSLLAADTWLVTSRVAAVDLATLLGSPTVLLVVFGIVLGSTLVHELGHAAACHSGGALPGRIGVAVYVVCPVFFADVTESYRLSRTGRVRTDLGGVYFMALTVLGLTAIYAHTLSPAVLVAIVLVHGQMLLHVLPLGRLDGYFVVADLVGVPDLFSRIGPVLRSLVPGRPPHPKVAELRPSARTVVALWVLTVGPFTAALIGLLLWNAPRITIEVGASMRRQWVLVHQAIAVQDTASIVLAALSLLLLPVPVIGLVWLAAGVLRRLLAAIAGSTRRHRSRRRSASRGGRRAGPGGPKRVTPGERTADDFLEAAAATAKPPPSRGALRRTVFAVTAGHVNPGPGANERRQNELLAQVRTRFDGSRRIVVMSRKGGVGKTTTTLMLGHTFAAHRGDRVVAVDANPDAGNLATRIQRETTNATTDLLVNRAWVQRYAQIRSYTSQHPGSRLEVIASDDDAGISLALGNQDYRDLIDTVDHFYNLILVDTGTGILGDANQGILQEADQLVLVMPPALDGGRVAAMTLDWLDHHGYQEYVWRAVAVVNGMRGTGTADLDRLLNHLRWRCASIHRIPWDPALDGGAQTSLGDLAPATRQAYLELAGAVAGQFGAPGRPLLQ